MRKPPRAWVSADVLRTLFNNGGYWEQIKAGTLTAQVVKDRIPDPPPPGHPVGTHSQYVRYYDSSGKFVAAVHQYVLPNGNLGGWGKPDPKELVTDEYHYYVLGS
jgi:hypothetical protein